MSWNPVVIHELGKVGQTSRPQSYAHRCWFDYETSLGNIMGEFLLVRFLAAITSSGVPVALTYDATDGIWTATPTYSAALAYSFGGITVQSNVVPMVSSAAMTAGLGVQHSAAADTKVKEVAAATTADYQKTFGILLKAQAGAGTIGVGELALLGRF
jgi:hypothetical protein